MALSESVELNLDLFKLHYHVIIEATISMSFGFQDLSQVHTAVLLFPLSSDLYTI